MIQDNTKSSVQPSVPETLWELWRCLSHWPDWWGPPAAKHKKENDHFEVCKLNLQDSNNCIYCVAFSCSIFHVLRASAKVCAFTFKIILFSICLYLSKLLLWFMVIWNSKITTSLFSKKVSSLWFDVCKLEQMIECKCSWCTVCYITRPRSWET